MFLAAALFFAAGIYAEAVWRCPLVWLLPCLFIPLAVIPPVMKRIPSPPVFCLMALLFAVAGMFRLGLVSESRTPLTLPEERAIYEALVIEASPNTKILRILEPLQWRGVKAVFRTEKNHAINDRVRIFGDLRETKATFQNPSLISWRWVKGLEGVWYEIRGIPVSTAPGTNYVQKWRRFLAHRIDGSGAQYGGMLKALTIGDTSGLDDSTKALFLRTGTSHILAISGSNIGIVTAFFFFLARFLLGRSRRLRLRGDDTRYAALLSIPFAVLFMITAGSGIPIVRATIMIVFFMAALFFERGGHVMDALGLSALLILLLYPHSLFSPSFQLTFASVFFIVVWTGKVSPFLRARGRIVRWLLSTLIMTCAATLGTLPIVLHHFYGVNPFSLVHNLVAIPPICLVAMPMALVGLVVPWGEYLVRWAGDILALTVGVLRSLDWGYLYPLLRPSLFECLLYFTVLISLIHIRKRAVAASFIFFLLPFAVGYGTWAYEARFHGSSLCVHFIDVGLGDAVLVEAPGGIRMLVDGGGQLRGGFDVGKSVIAPFLLSRKIRTLDYVINTHPHADHAGGLVHVLQNFKVRHYVTGAAFPGEYWFLEIRAILRERGIPFDVWKRGESWRPAPGMTVEVLNPEKGDSTENANNSSLVIRITYRNRSFLLTGDIDRDVEGRLIRTDAPLRATVVKVPHHGSRFGSSPAFVTAVRPELAVLSVGRGIKGLPGEEALGVYGAFSIPLFRTDRQGMITVCTDGHDLTCRTFR